MSDKYKPPLSLRVWTTMLTNDAMRMSNEEKLLYDLFPLIKKYNCVIYIEISGDHSPD